jgi:hypothetical protein
MRGRERVWMWMLFEKGEEKREGQRCDAQLHELV